MATNRLVPALVWAPKRCFWLSAGRTGRRCHAGQTAIRQHDRDGIRAHRRPIGRTGVRAGRDGSRSDRRVAEASRPAVVLHDIGGFSV